MMAIGSDGEARRLLGWRAFLIFCGLGEMPEL